MNGVKETKEAGTKRRVQEVKRSGGVLMRPSRSKSKKTAAVRLSGPSYKLRVITHRANEKGIL